MSNDRPTLVLVHGAWHGPWCWERQIPEFAQLGYDAVAIDLPCVSGIPGKTQFDDAAAVKASIEPLIEAGKRVVVIAHSYGGPIASAGIIGLSLAQRSAAGLPGGVLGMISLCAYIFPGGMDQGAAIRALGGLPFVTWDDPSEGLFTCKIPRELFFPPDVSEELMEEALPKLRPQSMAANMGIVPPQAWQDDEHYSGALAYIKTTADPIIPIADQEAMIASAGGEEKIIVRSLEGSGHSPFLSRPKDVASTVDDIVRKFESFQARSS